MGLWGWIYFVALMAACAPALLSTRAAVRRLAWLMLLNWTLTRAAVASEVPHEVMAVADLTTGALAVILGGVPGFIVGMIFFAMPIVTWAMTAAPAEIWLAMLDLGGFVQLAIIAGASDGGRRVMDAGMAGLRGTGRSGVRLVVAAISGVQALGRKDVR